MEFEYREIAKDEFDEFIELQAVVGGLPPRDTMSPITFSAMSIKDPRVGWLSGAFHKGRMVGFINAFATARPGTVFGHMLGVLPEYRDFRVGQNLLRFSFEQYKKSHMQKVCWTYEPLESRNSHLYLNNLGGRIITYFKDHYRLDSGLHHGMPQDRFLIEFDMDNDAGRPRGQKTSEQALDDFPLASQDSLPRVRAVLVEIPGNLREIQNRDETEMLEWRMRTREVFDEYINNRGLQAVELFSNKADGQRRSYILLKRMP